MLQKLLQRARGSSAPRTLQLNTIPTAGWLDSTGQSEALERDLLLWAAESDSFDTSPYY